jgi:hypothetical protein
MNEVAAPADEAAPKKAKNIITSNLTVSLRSNDLLGGLTFLPFGWLTRMNPDRVATAGSHQHLEHRIAIDSLFCERGVSSLSPAVRRVDALTLTKGAIAQKRNKRGRVMASPMGQSTGQLV